MSVRVPCDRVGVDCARCGHMPELHAEGGRCMAVWSAGGMALHECPCDEFVLTMRDAMEPSARVGVKPFDRAPDPVYTPEDGREVYTPLIWLWNWLRTPVYTFTPVDAVLVGLFLFWLWLGF